jgi:hypothetical protein
MSDYIEKMEQLVDTLTGELLRDEITFSQTNFVPNEPAYIKLYIEDLGNLCRLTAGETKILLQITALANYNGIVALPAGIKADVAVIVGCKPPVVNNALTSFCNHGVLKRNGIGVYELNPDYFARGKWREIRERRKEFYTTTTYRRDGTKEVETNVIETLPNVGE